jgi:hypothetical protein
MYCSAWSILTACSSLLLLAPSLSAWQEPGVAGAQAHQRRMEYQSKLNEVLNDRAGYVARIVSRWESAARESGRWEEDFVRYLTNALMRLQPENLLAAGEAPSYAEMMNVIATGPRIPAVSAALQAARAAGPLASGVVTAQALGDTAQDLVYTPLTPCRMFDTRVAGGALAAQVTRTFDADGGNFSAQGGSATGCDVPFGVARAIAITLTVTAPAAWGWLTAWGLGAMPVASVLNYSANQTVANTTILPIVPGAGNDFSLNSSATGHYLGDVVGYFAAPAATPLDCTEVEGASTAVATGAWTSLYADCPVGRTVTGGGWYSSETGPNYMGVLINSLPFGNSWRIRVYNSSSGPRSVSPFAVCCRIPGR